MCFTEAVDEFQVLRHRVLDNQRGGLIVYGALKAVVGLRLDQEEEFQGADLSIHKISASPERDTNW